MITNLVKPRLPVAALAAAAVAALLALAVGTSAASAVTARPHFYQKGALLAKQVTFKTLKSTSSILETEKGRTVECGSDEVQGGKITNDVEGVITAVKFSGKCHSTAFGGGECRTAGEPLGTIVTKPLYFGLWWINHSSEEPGVVFTPQTKGGPFAEFECVTFLGTEVVKVGNAAGKGKDSLVCHISPFKEEKKLGKVTCKQTKGIQEPKGYEEEKGGVWSTILDYLETEGKGPENFAFEQSGESATEEVEFGEAVEVK